MDRHGHGRTTKPIGRSDLEALAVKCGHYPWEVKVAVHAGHIPQAVKRGLGRGRGVECIYPAGTDKALRNLFKRQGEGLRGDALNWVLWWDGTAPWSPAIPAYVVSVLTAPGKELEARLNRRAGYEPAAREKEKDENDAGDEGNENGGDDEPTDDKRAFAKTLNARLNQALDKAALCFFLEALTEIDHTATLNADEVGQVVRVFTATMMKLFPEDLDASVFRFLAAYLTADWDRVSEEHPAPGGFQPDQELVRQLVIDIHALEWFEQIVEFVKAGRPEGYEIARRMVRGEIEGEGSQIIKTMTNVVTSVMKQAMKAKSKWEIKRVGPWQMPEPATQALVLGYLIGIAKWIQITKAGGATVPEESHDDAPVVAGD